jgi:hypothetical protein
VIHAEVLPEPLLEFGFGATHQEQRAGIVQHGPADIEMPDRCDTIRVGLVGQARDIAEVEQYLTGCTRGLAAKPSDLRHLFPEFPGCTKATGFRAKLKFPSAGKRPMSRALLKPLHDAETDADKLKAAVAICGDEVRRTVDRAEVDVVVVARPSGIPDGVAVELGTGADFHDLLKADVIATPQPIQVLRSLTWRRSTTIEDPATVAWNLFAALFYKAGGKPWRLRTDRRKPSRCFVGVSFARSGEGDRLFATVAQVFNELGDGVVVRGAVAHRSQHDRQPHLEREDAERLLADALERYGEEHGTPPATVTLHKTSAFSDDERDGFMHAAETARLLQCELVWLSDADDAMLVRGTSYFPPLRGTLLTLSEDESVLYTHASVPYYRTYPGLHVPRPLGIRPCVVERPVADLAAETLALTKLNWNRARIDSRLPITLLTARRVASILRHVDAGVTPELIDSKMSLARCKRLGCRDVRLLVSRRHGPPRQPLGRAVDSERRSESSLRRHVRASAEACVVACRPLPSAFRRCVATRGT